MRENKKRGRYINLLVIVLLVVFYLGVAGAAGYYVPTYSQEVEARTTSELLMAEGNVKTGTLNDPERRQQELNSVAEEGMMVFSINATPSMTDGEGKANLMVENPPNNGKRSTVTIQRNDAGEVTHKSGYPDPEQCIDEVLLDAELPKDGYTCTAYFDAYRPNDDDYIGRAGAQIILYVLE